MSSDNTATTTTTTTAVLGKRSYQEVKDASKDAEDAEEKQEKEDNTVQEKRYYSSLWCQQQRKRHKQKTATATEEKDEDKDKKKIVVVIDDDDDVPTTTTTADEDTAVVPVRRQTVTYMLTCQDHFKTEHWCLYSPSSQPAYTTNKEVKNIVDRFTPPLVPACRYITLKNDPTLLSPGYYRAAAPISKKPPPSCADIAPVEKEDDNGNERGKGDDDGISNNNNNNNNDYNDYNNYYHYQEERYSIRPSQSQTCLYATGAVVETGVTVPLSFAGGLLKRKPPIVVMGPCNKVIDYPSLICGGGDTIMSLPLPSNCVGDIVVWSCLLRDTALALKSRFLRKPSFDHDRARYPAWSKQKNNNNNNNSSNNANVMVIVAEEGRDEGEEGIVPTTIRHNCVCSACNGDDYRALPFAAENDHEAREGFFSSPPLSPSSPHSPPITTTTTTTTPEWTKDPAAGGGVLRLRLVCKAWSSFEYYVDWVWISPRKSIDLQNIIRTWYLQPPPPLRKEEEVGDAGKNAEVEDAGKNAEKGFWNRIRLYLDGCYEDWIGFLTDAPESLRCQLGELKALVMPEFTVGRGGGGGGGGGGGMNRMETWRNDDGTMTTEITTTSASSTSPTSSSTSSSAAMSLENSARAHMYRNLQTLRGANPFSWSYFFPLYGNGATERGTNYNASANQDDDDDDDDDDDIIGEDPVIVEPFGEMLAIKELWAGYNAPGVLSPNAIKALQRVERLYLLEFCMFSRGMTALFRSLRFLNLKGAWSLESICSLRGCCPLLEELDLAGCSDLKYVEGALRGDDEGEGDVDDHRGLPSLKKLNLAYCTNFGEGKEGTNAVLRMSRLEEVDLSLTLVTDVSALASVPCLILSGCGKLSNISGLGEKQHYLDLSHPNHQLEKFLTPTALGKCRGQLRFTNAYFLVCADALKDVPHLDLSNCYYLEDVSALGPGQQTLILRGCCGLHHSKNQNFAALAAVRERLDLMGCPKRLCGLHPELLVDGAGPDYVVMPHGEIFLNSETVFWNRDLYAREVDRAPAIIRGREFPCECPLRVHRFFNPKCPRTAEVPHCCVPPLYLERDSWDRGRVVTCPCDMDHFRCC